MDTDKLSEIGRRLSGVIETFSGDSEGNVLLVTTAGKKLLIKGATIRKRGGHVSLMKNGETITLRLKRYQDKKKLSFSLLGLFISIILGFSANVLTSMISGKPPDTTVVEKIDELNDVKNVLIELDRYINGQKATLTNLSTQLKELTDKNIALQRENDVLRKAASIEKDKLDALLDYQNNRKVVSVWIERIASFIIGVFSSLTAAFLLRLRQSKKAMDV